ncbi:SusC/RagA family TonB-linked outer membrane protein [Mucilaginibacter sp. KACC 22773]|uniref:SusC/RagA family TonB-linked outer membrane protein n=1 Tax=Mucilaginibacter sp. KACC 22773 TaxID=3025671 RepID=UPI002366F098|nr:SusC/RagA family TonB-linked outer membrane protein [Mucilaginibacter sp. KACC 22773]WDF77174.1 SusC/RagA family TonB-linked outer membrane protein [Mucilaginibacter sp. KACC 22773]
MQKLTAFAKRNFYPLFKIKSRINWLFIMKLSVCCGAFLICSFTLLASTPSSGQSLHGTKISMEAKGESLKSALQKLQDQTGFVIFYRSDKINKYQSVTLENKQRSVAETLDLLLKGTNLEYQQDGNKIILSEKAKVSVSQATEVSEITVAGIVRDEKDDPLAGVTILCKQNHNLGTATDQNGHFSLPGLPENAILVFSFIGYETKEIPIGGLTRLDIHLKAAPGSLNEVQIIGYGQTTKRDNTGSVSSVTAKDLGKQTIDNPLVGLQGRVAGMQVTQDNGLPGAAVRVNIRGAYNPLSEAGYIPLYVIDGVPFTLFNGASPTSDNLNAYGTAGANGGVSPFSMIAPEDIERIDILKDADATAIYGSRGANGVVLITTKKGNQGRTTVNVNVNSGIGKVPRFVPVLNLQQYLDLRRQAYANAGATPSAENGGLDLTSWSQTSSTDWQKYFLGGTAHTTNATASISGGDASNTFLLSTTYRKQGTVFIGDYGSNSFSGRLNGGHTSFNRKFSINASANYSYMGTDLPTSDFSGPFSGVTGLAPNYPLYNPNGSLNWTSNNPVAYLMQPTLAQTTNLVTNVDMSYLLAKGLTLKVNAGYTLTRIKQQQQKPASSQNPSFAPTSSLTYTDNDNSNYIIEPQAGYVRQIGKGKLDVVAGMTYQQNKSTGVYLLGTGYGSDELLGSLIGASLVQTQYANYSLYKYTAGFARVNYNWDSKYIIDGTFRRDGSSRFGENKRFGNFGAVGASWIFADEEFMKNMNFLSFGKLRASYGLTGNDQIPNYQYYALYQAVGSYGAYDGFPTLLSTNIANPDLSWETAKKLDIALEMGILKDRVLLKVDYYRNRTSNILMYEPLPSQTGTTSLLKNVGATFQNRGFEFELSTVNVAKSNFKWTTNINLTINRDKILSFPGLADSYYATQFIVGQPATVPLLYHYTGPDPQNGLPTYQDKNGDGVINESDLSQAPYGHPFYGGITNNIKYKSLELDFTFQYNHRMGYKDATLAFASLPFGSTYQNPSTGALNRWMAPGSTGYYPVATLNYDPSFSNLDLSDYNWGDASYLKLKTVSLNYSLPKMWISRIGFSNATVYLQGQNLYTWAKQKYIYDPEVAAGGAGSGPGVGRFNAFPQLRTIVLGLNCSF